MSKGIIIKEINGRSINTYSFWGDKSIIDRSSWNVKDLIYFTYYLN